MSLSMVATVSFYRIFRFPRPDIWLNYAFVSYSLNCFVMRQKENVWGETGAWL